MHSPKISMIAAVWLNNELWKDNELIWRIPDDMKRFKELTSWHVVIMWRKTFESIPEKFRPLPNRINIVVSRTSEFNYKDTYTVKTFSEAISKAKEFEKEEIFLIWWASIYEEWLIIADKLYITQVSATSQADVYFPDFSSFNNVSYKKEWEWNWLKYTWIDLEK